LLSFYIFSFESIRDNLQIAESQFDEFNFKVGGEVDELYRNSNAVAIKYYEDRTRNLGKIINYFDAPTSNEQMQLVINLLVQDNWACEIKLFDSNKNLIAQGKKDTACLAEYGYTATSDAFELTAYYERDQSISNLTNKMTRFRDAAIGC
jgi:hypothetical protein